MKKLILGAALLLCCSMSFGAGTDEKKESKQKNEKNTLALHCEFSEARDENGSVIARASCCLNIPTDATFTQRLVTIISLRLCAEKARDLTLNIKTID